MRTANSSQLPGSIDTEYRRFFYLAFPEKNRRREITCAKWHKAHPIPSERRWASRYPQEHLEKGRRWRADNREKDRILKLKWLRNNPQKRRAATLKWERSHPDILAANCAKRYALKMRARIGCPKEIVKIYARAKELRQWFDVAVDHIIPLSKGGEHSPKNLQIIYRSENLKKGVSLGYTPRVIFI